MRKRYGYLLIILVSAIAGSHALAVSTNLTVDDDLVQCPTANYTNIQDAIAACDGDTSMDTITVYAGTYNNNNTNLMMKKYVTLQAAPGPTPLITSTSGAVIWLPINHVYMTIDGFIIDGQGKTTSGIYADSNGGGSPRVDNVVIRNNCITNINGSGIYMRGRYQRYWTVNDNIICCCTNYGLYMYARAAEYTFKNNLVIKNGAGIYATTTLKDYICYFFNNTIADNDGAGFEGDFFAGSYLTDCVVYGNGGTQIDTSIPVSFSCVEGGCAGTWNITNDPLFVVGGSDYRLQTNSPCRDSGYGYTEMGWYGSEALYKTNRKAYTDCLTNEFAVISTNEQWTGAATHIGLSNDGTNWTVSTFPAAGTTNWVLSNGEGWKTVFYRPLASAAQNDILPGATNVTYKIQHVAFLPVENLSNSNRYLTIQEAINDASGTVTVEVQTSGTFEEALTLKAGITIRARTNETPTITMSSGRIILLPLNNSNMGVIGFIIDGQGSATAGIYADADAGGSPQVSNVTLQDNCITNINGSGLHMHGRFMYNWVVERNKICCCTNYGIYINARPIYSLFRNNLVINNAGGGIYGSTAPDYWAISYFVNNTIANNGVLGFDVEMLAGAYITGCIIYSNGATEIDTMIPVSYCCIKSGYTGSGNTTNDPAFLDPANGDYSLEPTSLCKDTGNGYTEHGRYGGEVFFETNRNHYTDCLTNEFAVLSSNDLWTGTASHIGLSNDGTNWTVSTFPGSGMTNWVLTAGPGLKKVHYRPLASADEDDLLAGSTNVTYRIQYMSVLPVVNLTTSNRYGTIQDAINEASGTVTIEVQSSATFEESVSIKNDITLLAANGETPRIASALESVVNLQIDDDNMTVEGFIIDGLGQATYGILANTGGGRLTAH